MMLNRAVFFDRDDTLVKDVPYNGDPSKVELLPNAAEALALLDQHSFKLFLITNQSGVGRGMITREQVQAVNDEMIRQLGKNYFTAIYCCYDDPENPIEGCRKPDPGMLFQARDDHDLALDLSYFVGDKLADIQAGHNAGCKSILKDHGSPKQDKARKQADYTAPDLLEIAHWILADAPNS